MLLHAWLRYEKAPDDVATNQAILAWATDGFLIGTAMRPHAGIGQAEAHQTLSTGLVGHTLTFHEPFSVRDWLLIAHESPHARRPPRRVLRADNMIRAMAGRDPL